VIGSSSANTSYGSAGAQSSALAAMPPSHAAQLLSNPCSKCKKELKADQVLRCSRCQSAIYCGRECQKKDWKNHKLTCTSPQPTAAAAAASSKTENVHTINKTVASAIQVRRRFLSLEDVNCFDNEGFRVSLSEFKLKIENNFALRSKFDHFKSPEFNHPAKTKEFILEGCEHLDPEKSVVVVCGAQYYEDQFVEPLNILLHKCKRLILVDIDGFTLDKLKANLESQKVTAVKMDLSFASKLLQAFMDEVGQNRWKPIPFYEKVVQLFTQIIEHVSREPDISFPLEAEESIDFLISSLTASQLATKVKLCVYLMMQECFRVSAVDFIAGLGHEKREILQKVSLQLNAVMIKRHASQLFACAGRHGSIYLADAVRLNEEDQLILPDTLLDLKETFGQENWQERNWHWVQDPEHVYSIHAFLRKGMKIRF